MPAQDGSTNRCQEPWCNPLNNRLHLIDEKVVIKSRANISPPGFRTPGRHGFSTCAGSSGKLCQRTIPNSQSGWCTESGGVRIRSMPRQTHSEADSARSKNRGLDVSSGSFHAGPRILVIGSVNTDLTIQLRDLPGPGETVIGSRFATSRGGKGANQAVAAARAGGVVSFICSVGNDGFGNEALDGLRAEGIQVQQGKVPSGQTTGVALILVSKSGENCIAVAPGANACLLPSDIARNESMFTRCDRVLLQLETPLPTVLAAARAANRFHVPVILNPAPVPARFPAAKLLPLLDMITPNASEASALSGIAVRGPEDAHRAARWLQQRGVRNVAVTLGSQGVHVSSASDGEEWIPALKVKAVDTVGAGDVFNGALAVGLAAGWKIQEAARFAVAAAGISVTRRGAQASAPGRKEILKKMGKLVSPPSPD